MTRSIGALLVLGTVGVGSLVVGGCAATASGAHDGTGASQAAPFAPSDAGATSSAPERDGGASTDAGETVSMSVLPKHGDICGNGVDEDDDGIPDDDCGCIEGSTRACYTGPPTTADVGTCRSGVQACVDDDGFWSWGPCVGATTPGYELLDNELDDDCDGTTDEPDGVCVPRAIERPGSGGGCKNGRDDDCDGLADCADPACKADSRCPATCEAFESLCSGGHDDDCDGAVDCDDLDCLGAPGCASGTTSDGASADAGAAGGSVTGGTYGCPSGTIPTYRPRPDSLVVGPASITNGDGEPVMERSCEAHECEPGFVALQPIPGVPVVCVPPPPECSGDQSPSWDPRGAWTCSPPCELLVHFGTIYGSETVCTSYVSLECAEGELQTFVFESRQWECQPCDLATYDLLMVGGRMVCVPC